MGLKAFIHTRAVKQANSVQQNHVYLYIFSA